MRRIVAGHVRNHQREYFCFAHRGKTAALNQRQVFSDRVDLLDHRAAVQEFSGHQLQVVHGNGLDRQAQQRGAAARNQHEQQIVFRQPLDAVEDAFRCGLAGFVGHRVAGFDDADAISQEPVRVTRDDRAFERGAGRPMLFHRERHRGGGFSRADDKRAALGRRRQMLRYDLQRIGRGNCCFETAQQ